jgi:hypothetical protein
MSGRAGEVTSGFVSFDYILTFTFAGAQSRDRLEALCKGEWSGTQVSAETWELETDLTPVEIEAVLAPLLGRGERAVFYYVTDAKRVFRVLVEG